MPTITPEQTARRTELRAHYERYQSAWKKHATFSRDGSSSADLEQQSRINAETPGGKFTNELMAELETLEFLMSDPRPEFLYPARDSKSLTGFMGNTLAHVTSLGAAFCSNMGDTRQTFRARGINGANYFGTIFGTYARMRPLKR